MSETVFAIQGWITLVLSAAAVVVEIWAFVSAARSRAEAYPAVNRLSKILWLVILGVGTLLTIVSRGGIGILALIGAAAAIYYLVDVRPRVREVTPQRRTEDDTYAGW